MRWILPGTMISVLVFAGLLGRGIASSQPGPTPSPIASATEVRPATPTAAPEPVHLPLLLRERCPPGQRVDLVLAIDASQRTLAAASNAGRLVVSFLEPAQGDQASAISFGMAAALLHPLTGDHGAVAQAIGRIAPVPESCLPCGIEAAMQELKSERPYPGSVPVLVVLFGADATLRSDREALEAAQAVKQMGVYVVAIWFGPGADEGFLARLASLPELVLIDPTEAEMRTVLHPGLACPTVPFWPRDG